MKTTKFKQMLIAYAKKFNVDPKTPVLVSWGEPNDYHGIFKTDAGFEPDAGDGEKGLMYLICHDEPVYCGKYGGPVSFTHVQTWKKDKALSETLTFGDLLKDNICSYGEVKVLIATSCLPKNIIMDIDPWSCKLIDGSERVTLVLRCRSEDECAKRDCDMRAFSESDCKSEASSKNFLQKEFEGFHADSCDHC